MRVGEHLRYGRVDDFPAAVAEVDGMTNWWAATRSSLPGAKAVKLDAGINSPAPIAPSAHVPFVAIRSSPHKAGSDVTPWEDVHRPDDGYVRYFGDNKPTGPTWAHLTLGNRRMLAAWRQHSSGDAQARMVAPPVLVFQGFTFRGRVKGQVVFNGFGVIERAELVVQADPRSSKTFTNYRFDVTLLDLAREGDVLDWKWLDARRDPTLDPAAALHLAPHSWKEWVRLGSAGLDRLRRNVLHAHVVPDDAQRPAPGSQDHAILAAIYAHYMDRRHRFEALADFVTGRVLDEQGITYTPGWITRGSADGGVDFVGRIDLDPAGGFLSSRQVLLGQAKCESPLTPTNGLHLARLVARLRRGWFGAYVTTSFFSRSVQREVLADRYPLMLLNGARVASVVRRHLLSAQITLPDLLDALDSDYEMRIGTGDPELVLSV